MWATGDALPSFKQLPAASSYPPLLGIGRCSSLFMLPEAACTAMPQRVHPPEHEPTSARRNA
eukprot:6519716-Alexandrium_andersonii.AAC.1